jgi:hypothetical protein
MHSLGSRCLESVSLELVEFEEVLRVLDGGALVEELQVHRMAAAKRGPVQT